MDATFPGMHVLPAKHSFAWLPRQCDYRTDRHTDRHRTKWSLLLRVSVNPLWVLQLISQSTYVYLTRCIRKITSTYKTDLLRFSSWSMCNVFSKPTIPGSPIFTLMESGVNLHTRMLRQQMLPWLMLFSCWKQKISYKLHGSMMV